MKTNLIYNNKQKHMRKKHFSIIFILILVSLGNREFIDICVQKSYRVVKK